jgi:adenine C2-methylase RlmN of 23S rRNA A2503 and tRNA A37
VLRAWVQARSLDTKRRRAEDFLPLAVRDELPGIFDELRGLARVHSEHPGDDGSARLLVWLADGQTVESVLLPRDRGIKGARLELISNTTIRGRPRFGINGLDTIKCWCGGKRSLPLFVHRCQAR